MGAGSIGKAELSPPGLLRAGHCAENPLSVPAVRETLSNIANFIEPSKYSVGDERSSLCFGCHEFEGLILS